MLESLLLEIHTEWRAEVEAVLEYVAPFYTAVFIFSKLNY